jgi:chromosome segregation ATPase
MLTTALVLAIIGGAALSGVATGGLQDVLRMTGIGRGGEIEAQADDQQRQQSAVLAELERMIFTVSGEVGALNARIDEAARPAATLREQYSRLDADVGSLRGQIAAMRLDQAKASTPWRGASSELEAALKSARIDIEAMRASIDGRDELERKVLDSIGRRLTRLESAVSSDATGSIRRRSMKPMKRHIARAPADTTWTWQRAQTNETRF